MKIICIGDSLTEGDYGIKGTSGVGNVQPRNYPFFLQELTGAEVVNLGVCGQTSTGYLNGYRNGRFDFSGADVFIVMLGTNGGMSGEEDTQENRDYDTIIDLCREASPSAKIYVCTPPHATENPEYSNCGYMPRIRGAVDYVRKYVSTHNDVTLIDVASCPDFTEETVHIMQPNDGLHFGEEGYKTLAKFIYDHMA